MAYRLPASLRLLFLLTVVALTDARAQLPFNESFRNTVAPDMVFGGNPPAFLTADSTVSYPGGTVSDGPEDGFLRLTSADPQQRGYAYNNNSFPAYYGLKISFEYYTYGGDGADGICFFLFDAATTGFHIGGFGGSLGYTRRTNQAVPEEGLSGGYLGIGIDEYGNFYNYNEGRYTGPGGAVLPNTVALRGKGDGSLDYWYNNVPNTIPNYDYITHAQTTALADPFAIQGGMLRATDTTDSNYRKVEIDLAPRTITVNGVTGTAYTISVRIITGSASGPVVHNVITNVDYDQLAPPNLKFGYAASTGGSRNYHEIRNIDIRSFNPVTNSPTAAGRVETVCSRNSTRFLLRSAITPVNMPLGLDSGSLRFINPANPLDTVTSVTIAGVGTITADSNGKGRATFVADPAFTSGSATVRFVMDDNYGKTSNPAVLTLNAAPGISANTVAGAAGSSLITGSTPSYGSAYIYRWEESTTSATAGYSAAPGVNNAKDYTVPASPAPVRWYRRAVASGRCISYSNVQAFSATAIPLPVTLTGFTAVLRAGTVALCWSTENEQGMRDYTVERSSDGTRFAAIRTLESRSGSQHSYECNDLQPAPGGNFYRIAMRTLSGETIYSPVRSVSIGAGETAGLALFPNPVANQLQLEVTGRGVVTVTDALGRVMMTDMVQPGTQSLDVRRLHAGSYYLLFSSSDGSVIRQRFSKL